MKKIVTCICFMVLVFLVNSALVSAENEIKQDKEAIQKQKEEIKTEASAAKQEEKALKDQIHAAMIAGDSIKVQQLKDQLKDMHKENVEDKKESAQEMEEMRQEGPAGGAGTNLENHPGPVGGPGASPARRGGRR